MSLLMDALKKAEEAKRKEKAAAGHDADTQTREQPEVKQSPVENFAADSDADAQPTETSDIEGEDSAFKLHLDEENDDVPGEDAPFKLKLEEEHPSDEEESPFKLKLEEEHPTAEEESPFKLKLEEEHPSDEEESITGLPARPESGGVWPDATTTSPKAGLDPDPSAMTLQMDIPDFSAMGIHKEDSQPQDAQTADTPDTFDQPETEESFDSSSHEEDAAQAIEDLFMEAGEEPAAEDHIDTLGGMHTATIQPPPEQPPIDYEALMALKDENRERARQLFKGKKPARQSWHLLPIVLSAVLVAVLLAGTAGYFWLAEGLDTRSQFMSDPGSNDLDSSQTVTETSVSTQPAQDTVTAAATSDNANTEVEQPGGAVLETPVIAPPASEPPVALSAGSVSSPSVQQPSVPAATAAGTTPASTATADQPGAGSTADSFIKVNRGNTTRTRLDQNMKQAWEAYQAGNLEKARALYSNVLASQPTNRNALLGKAAIARQLNNPAEARKHYISLLERNPKDPHAQAGLIALFTVQDPVAGISRIKLLLEDYPKVPALHFTLGNLYARQYRWIEAQQAYFTAWSIENTNPDYAYNVAVALDHLGKYAQALGFYEKSIGLSSGNNTTFSINAARQRIKKLNASLNTD